MNFATDGIITRSIDVGVSDKLLHVITPKNGRIAVMVKGGRSPKSQYTAISQLFSYVNLELSEKNSMYWLRGGSLLRSFHELSQDLTRVALATYLSQLADDCTDEGEGDCDELIRLLLKSLYLSCEDKKPRSLIKSVFEMRLACILGYLPELSGCVYCDDDKCDYLYLDVMGGRLICSECLAEHNKRKLRKKTDYDDEMESGILCGISLSVLAALRYIVSAPPNKIFSFVLKDEKELEDLARVTEAYILNHLGRGFDSLDFYKSVK